MLCTLYLNHPNAMPILNAGDPWLQGGVVVVSPRRDKKAGGGTLWFHEMETSPGFPIHDLNQISASEKSLLLPNDWESLPIFNYTPKLKNISNAGVSHFMVVLYALIFFAAQCYISSLISAK